MKIYKVPDVFMWINLDHISSVEMIRHPFADCYQLWIFLSSGKPIKMCGDCLIDDFMEAFYGIVNWSDSIKVRHKHE